MKALLLSTYRRPYTFLILFSLLGVISFMAAKKITLDADISALLPENFESVQDLELVKEWFGGIGYVVVVGSGAEPDKLRHFADEVARVTRPIKEVSFVDYKRPTEFFKQRALYYLEKADLKTVEKRLKKRYKWEKNSRNPMYINLEDDKPPSIEFDDLQQKYSEQNSSWMSSQQSTEAYYLSKNKDLVAVFIKPNITAANLDFSTKVLQEVATRLETIDYSIYGPNFSKEITGRYQKQIDLQKQMQSDMGIASLVALALVILYLLIHFKRIEALVLIVTPLVLGLLFTFAFADLVFGQLNILTAFIGVILLGLGIDHGIHLLSRYLDEQHRGIQGETAINNTFIQTGRAVMVAALTTFVTFLGLSFSEFRAFFEFGLIAAAGMVFITLAYLLVMPPMLKVATRFTWKLEDKEFKPKQITKLAHLIEHHRKGLLIGGIIVGLGFSLFVSQSRFNYDFDSLANANIRSFVLDRQVNELLGYSQTPMVALTHNKDEERYVTQQILDRKNDTTFTSGVDFTLSTSDLVPIEQEDKQKLIAKIGNIIEKVNPTWLKAEELEYLEDMKHMVASLPFTYSELPDEIRLLFGDDKSQDEGQNGIVMLFPSIKLSDGEKVISLADEIRSIVQSGGDRLIIAGEAMILADILNMVFSESPKVFSACGIMIFAILWLFMRSFFLALLCLVPAVFTLSTTLGVMAVFNLELNYINILMIPVLLGISVDSGVHMVNRIIDGDSVHTIISETGTAIFGSILTSGLGIGALLLTEHSGLNSLAQIGTIGLFVNLLVSLLVFPALLSLTQTNIKNEGVMSNRTAQEAS